MEFVQAGVIETGKWLITTEPPRWNGVICVLCDGPVQRHIHVDPENKSELWACACGRTSSIQLPAGKLDFGL